MKFQVHGREYDMPEFDSITFREANTIKKITGLRMGELPEAFGSGDTDAMLALFVVAKMRADGTIDLNAVQDLQIDTLQFVEEEVAEDPPVAEDGPAAEEPSKTKNSD